MEVLITIITVSHNIQFADLDVCNANGQGPCDTRADLIRFSQLAAGTGRGTITAYSFDTEKPWENSHGFYLSLGSQSIKMPLCKQPEQKPHNAMLRKARKSNPRSRPGTSSRHSGKALARRSKRPGNQGSRSRLWRVDGSCASFPMARLRK